MNPLSPLTYYRRNKRSALLQIALISLATTGLCVLVGVLDAIPLRANVSYLSRLSQVIPTGGALDPAVVSQIEAHPEVAHIVPDNGLRISLPTLLGTDSQRLLGVSPEEARHLMEHCGVRLKEGRLFEPRTNEIMLSEEVARALDLELGSEIGRAIDQRFYETVPAPLELVGILEADPTVNPGPSVRLGFASAEYLQGHDMYAPRVTSLLVIAREGHRAAVDEFLETTIDSKYMEVQTFASLAVFFNMARVGVYVVFGAVNSVVGVVMALVVGIINRIALDTRLNEFGLLHALGRRKGQLIRRLTLETATVAGMGCLLGLGSAVAIMWWLKNGMFYKLGMELDLLNLGPFCFVLPIPLILILSTFLSLRKTVARLDAVTIVEQGKLSAEPNAYRPVIRSSVNPLSAWTFYLRHRRRGLLILLGTSLMVLGITFPVFLLSAMFSAMMPTIDYLQYVSMISPFHSELDPGVVSQVKGHPAVARTVPAVQLGVQMVMPPGGATDVRIFGVPEADLPVLLDSFGLYVREGRLPRPRSNEIVISAAIATNRDLHVGDLIGGETEYSDSLIEDDLPTEMVVAGLLSPDRPWLGFASHEYLQSHELTSSRGSHLLIIPKEDGKQVLDSWLEGSVDPTRTRIVTHAIKEGEHREATTTLILTFALLEGMIAAVAAIALATLNHVFFTQRREEYGVLNAIGLSRLWLVQRTVKEAGSVIGMAWVAGAMLCGIALICMQRLVYAPRGLPLDLFSPVPWLLTLPLPIAVLAASAGTIAWMLSRLNPVSIIERR